MASRRWAIGRVKGVYLRVACWIGSWQAIYRSVFGRTAVGLDFHGWSLGGGGDTLLVRDYGNRGIWVWWMEFGSSMAMEADFLQHC